MALPRAAAGCGEHRQRLRRTASVTDMDWPRRTAVTLAVVLLTSAVLSTSGCAEAAPPPVTTTPASTTVDVTNLTDDEALKIAVDAYQAYFAATSDVMIAGLDETEALRETSTSHLDSENNGILEDARQHKYEISGKVSIENTEVKSIRTEGDVTTIEAYACIDATSVNTLRDGQPTNTYSPENTGKSSVVMTVDNSESKFKAAGIRAWDIADFCS